MRCSHNKLTAGLMAATVGLSLFAALTAHADEALESVRSKMAERFESIDPENVDTSGIDGWYKIQQGAIVAYVSADGRYLMQGDMIDLDQNVNLTEQARNSARRELLESVEDAEVIAFTPAETRHSVTVFTDVDCGYCQRLHSQINDYLAKGIEVRYLLYPRNGPASDAWNVSQEVWCSADRQGALTAAKLDKPFESTACDASIVQQHWRLGREIGLSGTPSIVLEDGTLISGYLPPDQLAMRLEPELATE